MELTTQQLAKLSRIQGRVTTYEIICVRPDGSRVLICYAGQHSQRGLISILRERFDQLLAIGVPVNVEFIPRGIGVSRSLEFADGSVIMFSGRTRREAIIEGEHQLLGAMTEAA